MASVWHYMCRFTPQNWQPETTFQRVVTTACSPLTTYASLSHGPHLILHKCNQGTDYYKYGLGALYPLPQKVKGLGKKAVAKAFTTACRQRYKNVMTSKKMFHCQLLVWSQLAVSEGFGGITYCLADSNFGVSHGSVS